MEPGRRAVAGEEPQWIGVPFGSRARLIMLYLQGEALRTKSREIELGRSLNAWLVRLGIPVGGKSFEDMREQAERISRCRLGFHMHAGTRQGLINQKGAKSGQVLAVQVHAMDLDAIGYTALWPGIGMFPDWVRQKEFGIHTRAMEVSNGFVHWSDKRKLPIKPTIGVLGVAPVHGAVLTVDNGTHGGNIDVQKITAGSTVLFDVQQDGASLYVGDCHALQGDGECVGMGATEIGVRVTLSVELRDKPARMTWPRIETDTHIATLGCGIM